LNANPRTRGHPSLVGYGVSVLGLGLLGILKIKIKTDATIVLKKTTTTDEKLPKVHGWV
jgi:hypothetical protein